MRKRRITVITALGMACLLTACGTGGPGESGQSAETESSADGAEENTDSAGGDASGADNAENEAEGADGVPADMTIGYSEAVAAALSKAWNVEGEDETYTFAADGSCEHSLKGETETFQYACGFDEENNILVRITTGDGEKTYRLYSDETGYRLYMEETEGAEKKLLIPAGVEVLDIEDEKVSGLIGIWQDDGGNRYEFTGEGGFLILTTENSDGTFSAAEKKEENVLEICILVPGGALKYEYSVEDDGETLELYNRSAEAWYYWHREE